MAIIKNSITFGSGFNITAEGPIDSRMVVEYIDDLITVWDSNAPAYEGMMVSVLEDGNVYVLKNIYSSNSDSDDVPIEDIYSDIRNWKKIGNEIELDVDIEDFKKSLKKLSAPITVAGLSSDLGNVSNGKVYTTNNSVEDILRDLLCKEIYPSVTLLKVNPTISFGGINGASASNYKSIMKVGSILNLNPVTLNEATITKGYRVGEGFTYGYKYVNRSDAVKYDGNPDSVDSVSSLVGTYSLTETYSSSIVGEERTVSPSKIYENVKFDACSVVIGLGNNKISFSASSPGGEYTHPEYRNCYAVSNLGNTNVSKRLTGVNEENGELNSITYNHSVSVTGVYPVYVNISSDTLVDEPIEMELTDDNIFVFENVPSEVSSGVHFKFDYPSTHTITSFKIKDLSNNFVDYKSTYEIKLIEDKVVGNTKYNRLETTGNPQGKGTYKITLSKGLDEE